MEENIKQIIEQAKILYPPGTVFEPIYGNHYKELTILNANFYKVNTGKDIVAVPTEERLDTEGGGAAIWSEEKGWAKIIKASSHKIPNYSNTIFKCL